MKKLLSLLLSCWLLTGCTLQQVASIYDDPARIGAALDTYSIGSVEQTQEAHHMAVQVKGMSGMDTLWTYEAAEAETAVFTIDLIQHSGRVKLVHIAPDGTQTELLWSDTARAALQPGLNRIKVVAKAADFDLRIGCAIGTFQQIGFR